MTIMMNSETAARKMADEGFSPSSDSEQVRWLSADTRRLAAHYLSGAVGLTMGYADFSLSPEFLKTNPSPNRQAAEAVRLIALNAPLRYIDGELLAGAATLKDATEHKIPLTKFSSISHTTIHFEKALKIGYRGIRDEIEQRLARGGLDAAALDCLESMRICLQAAGDWHQRYVELLEARIETCPKPERANCRAVLDSLQRVPENPPATFREGIQALWLLWDFQRLCGNWSGIGRIDKMLGPLLKADLDNGVMTLDGARELLAHFWIKGCEWITADSRGSGDAQFYQNIVLAGVDENGEPVANEVTDLVLDVVEELHISDFPIAVRIDSGAPDCLLARIAAIQRLGGGIVAIYNDDRIIPNLIQFGYPVEEARNYANDGCWEVLISGKTAFSYQPFDAMILLQETLGLSSRDGTQSPDFPDFESLYADFLSRLQTVLNRLMDQIPFNANQPAPLLSLLVDGCIESAKGYKEGGAKYTALSPHIGGLPDVANSLLAIRRLIFERQEITLKQLRDVLESDWENQEPLRCRIRKEFDFYGNDSAEADALVQRLFNDYTEIIGRERERHGVLRPAGISTFGREGTDYLPNRKAAASGQKRGAILASNFSPSPGTDRRGPTAVIRSHCSVDFSRLPCGTALDLKISPDSVRGPAGIQALSALMRGFVRLGGIFMQIDVIDNELLRRAQEHPDEFPNLSVRVSGWSARFATLSKQWQDMIIARTEQRHG